MRKTNEFATKVAKKYVESTRDKSSYNIAYTFGYYYENTGKCGRDDVIKFLKENCINKKIDIDALITAVLSVDFDRHQDEVAESIREINAMLGIKQIAYPDKEAVLDIMYKHCTRKAYEAFKVTLDEFDSDEMKILRRFVELAARNMNLK